MPQRKIPHPNKKGNHFFLRGIRKWFQALDPVERKKVISNLKRYWYIPAGFVTSLGASGTVYYVSHLEDTPITGRRRFVALTHEQIVKISQAEARMVSHTRFLMKRSMFSSFLLNDICNEVVYLE